MSVVSVWGTYILKKKLKKIVENNKIDMNSARLELTPSNPKSGMVTI